MKVALPEEIWKERKSQDAYRLLEWGAKRGVHEKVVKVLEKRGLTTEEEVEKFLFGSLADATSPMMFGDAMVIAVNRIKKAFINGENIVVFGDYDADGVTGTTIMIETFKMLQKHYKFNVDYIISDRFTEGYGWNDKNFDRLIAMRPDLVITVDCGISSSEQIKRAKEEFNVETIITDHHLPKSEIPTEAASIVHPKFCEGYPTEEISGAAVAYQLCRGIWEVNGKEAPPAVKEDMLDLVGLGAVCDIMDLKASDNRIYIKRALHSISMGKRLALRLMGSESYANWKRVTPYTFGFQIGPRINAAGRMDDADSAVDMLLSRDSNEIEMILEELENRNTERKTRQEYIVEEGLKQLISPKYNNINVIVGDDFHEGIVGIAASKIAEKRYRPTFVLTKSEEGMLKGSARSIEDVNLFKVMEKFQEHLISWGGHHAAAGLSIHPDDLDEFFGKIEKELSGYPEKTWTKKNKWDENINAIDINDNLFDSMKLLEPTGNGFPQVTWKMKGIIDEKHPVSKNPNKQDPNRVKGSIKIDGELSFPYITWDKGMQIEKGEFRTLYGTLGYNDFSDRHEFTIKGLE